MAGGFAPPLLGLTQAVTQGVLGYGQGQLAARQLAYQMALQNLTREKDRAQLDYYGQRSRQIDSEIERTKQGAADTGKLESYYRTRYHFPADMPAAAVIAQGKERDLATVPTRPSAETPGAHADALRKRSIEAMANRGIMLLTGKISKSTRKEYQSAGELMGDLWDEFPRAPYDDVTAAAAQAWASPANPLKRQAVPFNIEEMRKFLPQKP